MKRYPINCNDRENKFAIRMMLCSAMVILIGADALGQAGTPNVDGALSTANSSLRNYFGLASQIMYAVGGIVGLVGAIKVYSKWNEGDNNTGKTAAAWFGSCIFLVMIGVAIKTFFGV